MRFCQYCRTEFTEGAAFCQRCGQSLNSVPERTPPSATSNSSIKQQIVIFAVIGAFIALIPVPGTSFLLIPMEIFLLYKIMKAYSAFDIPIFVAVAAGLTTASAFLKGVAFWLYFIVGLGSIANAIVAFGFIMAFGSIANHYYIAKTVPKTDSRNASA
jgi:uncharacterized protein (DUF697 family)